MDDKELTLPIRLEKYEALLRRLPKLHERRPQVEENARKLRAGYNGHKNLSYYLSLLPEKNNHIFHDIRLPASKSFFQMDALLFPPTIPFILESKNYSGTLLFERDQLIQIHNDTEKIYQNPVSQVFRHKILLQNFLEMHNIPPILFEPFVVVTQPSAKIIISSDYPEAKKRVCKSDQILMKIAEVEKNYKKELLDPKNFKKIKKLILDNHTPETVDILKVFDIHPSEIITGVQCPRCLSFPMRYEIYKWWICLECDCISKDAHLQAIHDHFLLIKPTVTNSELRHFLHLPSPRTTTHLLSKIELPHSGTNKGRIYTPK